MAKQDIVVPVSMWELGLGKFVVGWGVRFCRKDSHDMLQLFMTKGYPDLKWSKRLLRKPQNKAKQKMKQDQNCWEPCFRVQRSV